MAITDLIKKGRTLFTENNTTILTGIGVTGTITTAVLTGRASFKAAEIVRKDQRLARQLDDRDLTKKEIVKAIWPLYIPPVGVGILTITSIIEANRLGSKRTAAMAAAYSISERAFTEYKEKVVEKIGENKERALRDELAQDRTNKNPVDSQHVIITGAGEVLCYDSLSGRYFMSTVETLNRARNKVNYDIIQHMYASLSSFYDEIGIPPTRYSDDVGWNTDTLLELSLSTTMSTDNRPCIVLDFEVAPTQNYNSLY